MKKIAKLAAVLCVMVLSAACTFHVNNGGKNVRCKGPVADKMFDLKDFDSIEISGASNIRLLQGESFLVTVNANEEVFDHLNYRVEDGVLILGTIDNVTIMAEKYEVTVALPVLKSFVVNGAADADMKGYTASENLSIVINGAGDMDFSSLTLPEVSIVVNGAGDINLDNVHLDVLKIEVNGAGDAKVSGKAGRAVFSVSGVGGINAKELECEDIETHKSGIASIRTK